MSRTTLDVSVLLPFRDDEDTIGTACRRIVSHLTSLDLSFELLAIEEDSGDNSHAVLALLRKQIPQLSVLYASGREQGFSTGAEAAAGRVVWLLTPEHALGPLAPFHRAFEQTVSGATDAVLIEERFAICHRVRSLDALVGFRGRKLAPLRRRLGRRGARLEVLGAKRRWLRSVDERPLRKLIHVLSLR